MTFQLAIEVCFWFSVAALFYTYLGYPLLLTVVSYFRPLLVRKAEYMPTVSVIITAYNEARALPEKLENTLALDYPVDKLEIIVASDCSTDRTDEIIHDYASRGVRLDRQPERKGKTAAQNSAVEQAQGEIVLFSDATTLYWPDVLRVMLPNFADETVGCVAGRLLYIDPSGSSIGGAARSYWNYETFLKRRESAIGSLIGASGCLYAVRRSAYVPLYPEACSDFLIATKMVEQGLRAVYEPDAICTEETNKRSHDELQMRVRIITQTLTDLWRHRAMLNPLRAGFYALQLISHKVLRYLVPLWLVLIALCSLALASHSSFHLIVAFAQVSFYAVAVFSWGTERLGWRNRWLGLPQYFVLTNLASIFAFYRFARGHRYARWEPIRGGASIDHQGVVAQPKEF